MTIRYRKYDSYEEYIKHQSKKIDNLLKKKNKWSQKVRPECFSKQVRRFIPRIENFIEYMKKGKIICLGARTGIEVVAFRKMGFEDTIGIDLNPGKNNKYVIKGDFHSTNFNDNKFDNVYCNCIDHILDIDKFVKEIHRILINKGRVMLEISHVLDFKEERRIKLIKVSSKKKYESFACDDFKDIEKRFKKFKMFNFIKYIEIKDNKIIAIFENIKNK